MPTYICFLRGINVSGQKKIKMAELKTTLEKMGLQAVVTYIQSGNILFRSDEKDVQVLEEGIKKSIQKDFAFSVPTLVRTPEMVHKILQGDPFKVSAEPKNRYFTLLHSEPLKVQIEEFKGLSFPSEDFHYTKDCVYLNCKQGAGRAKLNNNLIEKKLEVLATTRNLNTMNKMLALSEAIN